MTSPSAEEVDVGAFSGMSAAKAPSLSAPNTLPEACHSPMKEWGPTERAESKKKKNDTNKLIYKTETDSQT